MGRHRSSSGKSHRRPGNPYRRTEPDRGVKGRVFSKVKGEHNRDEVETLAGKEGPRDQGTPPLDPRLT